MSVAALRRCFPWVGRGLGRSGLVVCYLAADVVRVKGKKRKKKKKNKMV